MSEETLKEEKRDSSSEGDFVDSSDTVHETLSSSSSNLNVPACPIVKSSSFSGVTEREILRSKIKELYKIYNDISCSAGNSLQEIQQKPENNGAALAVLPTADKSGRAGKYHKKTAPNPPKISNEKEDGGTSAIKATLVLKPGIIKSLSPPTEEAKSEIFLAHSPKAKRKSSAKNKLNSPISRLMMLPKKMAFWNKESHGNANQSDEKRFSWSMFSGSQRLKPLADGKMYSKSHEDLQNTRGLLSYNSTRKEDHFRVRKLSASPTFCRRLETAKTELDLD